MAEEINPLTVKAWAIGFMKEQVFRGDFDNPRLNPDPSGAYRFKDKKIEITCSPSRREGWLNCKIMVYLVRRSFPFRKLELVFATGFGIDIEVYRPGFWVDYLFDLTEGIEKIQGEREAERRRRVEDEERQQYDANFSPVDDSSIFKK